jgi:hypothetical protein
MYLLSVTRLRVKKYRLLPIFYWFSSFAIRQVARSSGFVAGGIGVDRKKAFWTATLWENGQSMQQFVGSGTHLKLLPKLREWCDEACTAHCEYQSEEIPDVDFCFDFLSREGDYSFLREPTADHRNKTISQQPRLYRWDKVTKRS